MSAFENSGFQTAVGFDTFGRCQAATIASRAVALLERTDAGKRPVRLLGAGVHGLLPDSQAGPGLTQPRSPRNDLMPA